MRFNGVGEVDIIAAQLEAFICTEERMASPDIVESWKLKETQYQVVSLIRCADSFLGLAELVWICKRGASQLLVLPLLGDEMHSCWTRKWPSVRWKQCSGTFFCRHQHRQLLQLRQFDGKRFWVCLKELAGNAACMLLAADPSLLAQQQQLRRPDAFTAPRQQLLMVNSPEPVSVLVSLAMGLQYELRTNPSQEKKVKTGHHIRIKRRLEAAYGLRQRARGRED